MTREEERKYIKKELPHILLVLGLLVFTLILAVRAVIE